MQRPGIGDEQRHAGSEAEPLQVAAVALQIVCRICAEDAVPGQKLIELGASGETKQPAQFDPAEMPLPEFVERQRFEHAAFDLAAGAEAPGELCRDADGDFRQGGGGAVVHIFFLPRPMSRTLSDIGIRPSAPATCGRRGSMCSITHSTTSGSAPRSPIWTRSRT